MSIRTMFTVTLTADEFHTFLDALAYRATGPMTEDEALRIYAAAETLREARKCAEETPAEREHRIRSAAQQWRS